MSRPPELDATGRPKVKLWPYLVAGLFIVGLPVAGAGVLAFLRAERRAAEACFTTPTELYRSTNGGRDEDSAWGLAADGRYAADLRRQQINSPYAWAVRLLDLKGAAQPVEAVLDIGNQVVEPSTYPDARRVIVASEGRRVAVILNVRWLIAGPSSPTREELNAYVWNGSRGAAFVRLPITLFSEEAFALSPDGRRALVGTEDSRLVLYDLDAAEPRQVWKAELDQPIISVAFAPDGERALMIVGDNTVRLWEIASGKELHRLKPPPNPAVPRDAFIAHSAEGHLTVAFNASGRLALAPELPADVVNMAANFSSAVKPDQIHLWDLETGRVRLTLAPPVSKEPGQWEVDSLAISPDGRLAVGGGRISVSESLCVPGAWLWDLSSGKLIRSFEFPPPPPPGPFDTAVDQVLFSADGRSILATWSCFNPAGGRPDAVVLRWRLPSPLGLWLLGTQGQKVDSSQ